MAGVLPDLSSHDRERLLHVIAQQAVKIIELENEVQKLSQASQSIVEQPSNGVTDIDLLRQAHANLQAEHAQCGMRYDLLDRKYQAAKKTVLEWDRFVKKRLTDGHNSTSSPSSVVKQIFTPLAVSRPPSLTAQSIEKARPSPHTTSSQSTVIEPEVQATEPVVEDDFVPEVVRERQIKRRRIERSPKIKQEPGTAEQPFFIHTDETDDAPVAPRFETQLSDLDAVASPPQPARRGKKTTPRLVSVRNEQAHAPGTGRKPLSTIDANRSIQRRSMKDSFLSDGKPETPSFKREKAAVREKLRTRPVESLELGDFIPNILYTKPSITFLNGPNEQGRICQPGCTRTACCGNKYRRMVEIGGAQVSGKTDDEALEHYLGARWKDLVEVYGPAKRRDLIMQAHAMCFAEQTGAQTRNLMRAKTPPGFWRMDMPSTQEINAQNREALENERHMIAQRHHEALRENGSWRFADEV